MKIPEPKCNCQCWKCSTNSHEGCESDTFICNIEWIRILRVLSKEDNSED